MVELIMAMGMATLVLAAVVYIAASMIRFSVQGSTRGDVSAWTLFGLSNMNKEIEGATYIEQPVKGAVGSDVLSGCSNWAMNWSAAGVGGQMHGTDPNDATHPVRSFYYGVCRLNTGQKDVVSGADVYVQVLVRCAKTGVCPYDAPLPSSIPTAPPTAAPDCSLVSDKFPTECGVVSRHVYKQNPNTDYYFEVATEKANVVKMHFTVGVATGNITASGKAPTALAPGAGLNSPTPQYLKIDTSIRFNYPYEN